MTGRPALLLVGHDASRTGAPMAARTFLRWLVREDRADVASLLLRDGPLAADLRALGPTAVADRWSDRALTSAARAGLGLGLGSSATAALARRHGARHAPGPAPDQVLANTLAAWPAAAAVPGRPRLACWVHELDLVADAVLAGHDRGALVGRTDAFVAAGARVGAMLVERWGVPADRVHVVGEPIEPPPPTRPSDPPAPGRGPARILGLGTAVPRKGLDAWIAVLGALARRPGPDWSATWLGMAPDAPLADLARRDVAAAGLAPRVRVLAPVADLDEPTAADGWARTTLLLHTAREDPDPLAVLEAAARRIPVVTWDTGGAADLLREAGLDHLVAPAGDLLGLVARVQALLVDGEARAAAGAALAAAAAPHLVATAGPRLWAAIRGPATTGPGAVDR